MLSAFIWVPILGAALIGLWPGSISASRARLGALIIASSLIVWTIVLLSQFDISSAGMQFSELVPWIDTLGLNYSLGVDGLSLPLLALTALLTWIAIYSTNESVERPRLYYSLILLVNAGVIGGFLAQNLLLFVLFYEVELIPFYLLIAIWGGTTRRGYAAMKFLIYTAVSGILILAAFLGLTWLSGSSTFDYEAIVTAGLPLTTQLILLTMLLLGFGIKIPLVPLHTWLPDAYVEASPPVAILLGWRNGKVRNLRLGAVWVRIVPRNMGACGSRLGNFGGN
jgi:NAD(P)H-quinone oxidoreductase subunit 4